jgi:uncharacterized 2Fe-2S/4Fe-4S cluster protein (DUF4445 family)
MKIKVISGNEIRLVDCSCGETVSDILTRNGFSIPSPCGGKGRCGKCRIRVSGTLSPLGASEKKHLAEAEINEGYRLGCCAEVLGSCEIYYENESVRIFGLSDGIKANTQINPLTGSENCFAAAVDIGTTTVAVKIYKMPECKLVYSACVENPQTKYGADIITRITYANEGGTENLKKSVRECVKKIYADSGKEISFSVVTGNTAMLHFYQGLDTSRLAVFPFTPASFFGKREGNIYYPKCMSAFVGADITCAVLASGMMEKKEAFLIDLGTNGEMAYLRDGKLTCCSTAAGPAFEGAGISHGMAASDGAIDSVYINEKGEVSYTVLGEGRARGICGSGLIDAVACMLEIGVVDETGYLEEDFEIGDSGVFITLEDIRAVQLAKSAIRAGYETLTKEGENIEIFYISGGFGNYVNKSSCVKIGLIPKKMENKIKVIGNGALSGAAMILKNKSCLSEAEKIAHTAKTAELATNPLFINNYIEYMMF